MKLITLLLVGVGTFLLFAGGLTWVILKIAGVW